MFEEVLGGRLISEYTIRIKWGRTRAQGTDWCTKRNIVRRNITSS